jgi:hypothetical protein
MRETALPQKQETQILQVVVEFDYLSSSVVLKEV